MIFGVYCIEDLKSGFLTPTIEINDNVARRNFEHAIMSGGNVMITHQEDFRLMKLGEFDSDTGRIVPADLISIVCDGKDVLL